MRGLFGTVGAIIVGYIAASLAAGFSYTALLSAAIRLTGSIAEPSAMSAPEQFRSLVVFALLASALIAIVALIPSLIAMSLLMVLRRTDIFSYIAAAVAVGICAVIIASRTVPYMDKLQVDWLTIATGIVAGAAYWAVMRKLAPIEERTR